MEHANTDAQAIIDTALEAAKPVPLEPGYLGHITVPDGAAGEVIDLGYLAERPRRPTGRAELHTAGALSSYTNTHKWGWAALYADQYHRTMVAVLNGNEPTGDTGEEPAAGWGDHRATLTLRHTTEWLAWAEHDGELLSQRSFAEHLEDHLDEVVSPPAAELLELAKTFQAKVGVEFESELVLESGQRRLTYKETVAARAGHTGQITIPKEFDLGLAPFEGTDSYRLRARLRYRINGGNLTIGYQLVRPEDVCRDAFAAEVAKVEEATGLAALRGVAPASLQ